MIRLDKYGNPAYNICIKQKIGGIMGKEFGRVPGKESQLMFFYGTLKNMSHPGVALKTENVFVRAKMYDLGSYPVVSPSYLDKSYGNLFEVDPAIIPDLDRYETKSYERIRMQVYKETQTGDEFVEEAWVYVGAPFFKMDESRKIETGRWNK